MDLFDEVKDRLLDQTAPLAARLRPRTLSEYIGQEHILGVGRLLRRAIETDMISSVILYGPPGTGKTTLARIIANTTRSDFISMNAVLSGVKEIKEAVQRAIDSLKFHERKSILFIDEVHRFNKLQQDALLPHVENGTLVLIGATTENPYFEVNKALVSRSRIFQLRPLTDQHLRQIIQVAITDKERGFGRMAIQITSEAVEHFVKVCNGDARSLLNALELAVNSTSGDQNGVIQITQEVAEESIQQKAVLYDKDGDAHYDTISAFIKSLRGSDPDAALYWMSRMIYAGEDPRFIFRRMIILAAEDVGLADPQALSVVMAAAQAYDYVGMPEGQFHLSQAALYLATCPKSNSTLSYFDALRSVQEEQLEDIPNHLKDGSRDREGFGHGVGYKYPHAYRDHWVEQQYLPNVLQGKKFYQPGVIGYEGTLRDEMNRRHELQLASFFEGNSLGGSDTFLEVISSQAKKKNAWHQRTLGEKTFFLQEASQKMFHALDVKPDSLLLDLHFSSGLFTWEAARRVKHQSVYTVLADAAERDLFQSTIKTKEKADHVIPLQYQQASLAELLERHQLQEIQFDRMIGFRTSKLWKDDMWLSEVRRFMPEGRLVLMEYIPVKAQRPLAYLEGLPIAATHLQKWQEAEDALFKDEQDPLLNWDERTLQKKIEKLTNASVELQLIAWQESIVLDQNIMQRLFTPQTRTRQCYGQRMLALLGEQEFQNFKKVFEEKLLSVKTTWLSTFALLVVDFKK